MEKMVKTRTWTLFSGVAMRLDEKCPKKRNTRAWENWSASKVVTIHVICFFFVFLSPESNFRSGVDTKTAFLFGGKNTKRTTPTRINQP